MQHPSKIHPQRPSYPFTANPAEISEPPSHPAAWRDHRSSPRRTGNISYLLSNFLCFGKCLYWKINKPDNLLSLNVTLRDSSGADRSKTNVNVAESKKKMRIHNNLEYPSLSHRSHGTTDHQSSLNRKSIPLSLPHFTKHPFSLSHLLMCVSLYQTSLSLSPFSLSPFSLSFLLCLSLYPTRLLKAPHHDWQW